MSDLELMQLYQELTASGEALARSVTMFVQSLPLVGPDDPVPMAPLAEDLPHPPLADLEPPPGAED
jgi:hypothetical protein